MLKVTYFSTHILSESATHNYGPKFLPLELIKRSSVAALTHSNDHLKVAHYQSALARTVIKSKCSSNACHKVKVFSLFVTLSLYSLILILTVLQVEHYKTVLATTESMLTSLQVRD